MSQPLTLTLYSRSYCSLCQKMRDQIRAQPEFANCVLHEVDIDQTPAFLDRYDELVPVLCHQENELFHYHFSAEKWHQFFAEATSAT
ncbi:glutaredoxin family protein [Parvibium lacunae]|uniref:Glutaredoxin family protein n=1 Tax=Parvibium lacunae TaxID=1888893 RepID=A0A368L3T5_9BURK|nr:glutaredoxin family protein [Parvibium lacunae]RCS58229.1 glutaredoxin family protein [Parvibium lacunae]